MRISDWSSDVCSSDLIAFMSVWRVTPTFSDASLRVIPMMSLAVKSACIVSIYRLHHQGENLASREIGRASWRERVCQYVSISVGAVSLKKKMYIYVQVRLNFLIDTYK